MVSTITIFILFLIIFNKNITNICHYLIEKYNLLYNFHLYYFLNKLFL